MVISTSTVAGDSDSTSVELDVKRVLTDCCAQSASCRFQLVHSEFSMHATFLALHDVALELQLYSEDVGGSLHSEAICCLSFPYGASFCAFLGRLIDVSNLELGERRVLCTVPPQLTVTNLRESFRVPVVEQAGLVTILCTPSNQRFTVSACDITEAGMEINFAAGDDHGLTVGTSVAVELQFRGKVVKRTAEIRRLVRNRCGLSFNRPSGATARQEAEQLRGIVLSLQQVWLKSRLA